VNRDERSRFAGDIDEGIIVRPEGGLPPGVCGCGCGRAVDWEDRYVTDRRPSVTWSEHHDDAVAIISAAGGSGATVLGAAATGDDGIGDELALSAAFPAGIDPVALDTLAAALEDLLDVGVTVVPVTRTEH
jgi:hypothetical protein